MKFGKLTFFVCLLAYFVLLAFGLQAWAGNPPPESPVIEGPEYWGVVVIDCNKNTATLRVKRVVDCEIQTQALIEDYGAYPICASELTSTDLLHQWVHGILFEELGKPIITKVKNFKKDGGVYSADVQIQFCINCGN
jgi:hypothetical protein